VTTSETYDVIIIGAGVVGCALARELGSYGVSVLVIEQADTIGEGTSKANTAILHTGFDCVPGTLESQLVRRGYELLDAYAPAVGIAVEHTGALLVAWDEEQVAALPGLAAKARANGYEHTAIISADEVYYREPHLGPGALGGLDVPGEAIIDPWSPLLAYALDAHARGVTFSFTETVTGLTRRSGATLVETTSGERRGRWVINAAGLSSGLLNELEGHHDFTVTPRRGELVVFDKLARSLVSSIILPVPTAHTKGVLISPTVFGNVLLGPTADDVDDPTATETTTSGLARLMAAGQRMMPELVLEEVTATYAGLRAATQHRDYQIHLHASEGYVCVGGIRSTGLTASLAIAEYVGGLLAQADSTFTVGSRRDPSTVVPPLGEGQVRPYLDAKRILNDPAYGQIICHCEHVTLGEIRDATSGPFPVTSLSALRRRTRALNGRCQGFFCGAEVVAALAQSHPPLPNERTGGPGDR